MNTNPISPDIISIASTECVGASLSSINANFADIYTSFLELSSEYSRNDDNLASLDNAATACANLNIPSVALNLTSAMIPKAWLVSTGTTTTVSGTASKASITVTVNITSHGFITGDVVYVYSATSGITGNWTVTRITDDQFTYTHTASGTIASATVYYYSRSITSGYNVRKIIRTSNTDQAQYRIFYKNALSAVGPITTVAGKTSATYSDAIVAIPAMFDTTIKHATIYFRSGSTTYCTDSSCTNLSFLTF